MVENKLLVTDPQNGWLIHFAVQEVTNRERFLLNHPEEFRLLDHLIGSIHRVWLPVGPERDQQGRSHCGLMPFVVMMLRHTLVASQRFMACQSFSAWPTFRPGVEALLFLGKWVDDPANANVWRDRRVSKEASQAYTRTFGGNNVISTALPRSKAFFTMLKTINDDWMHPNPEFMARDFAVERKGAEVVAAVNCFDASGDEVEAHLLAFLHVLDLIRMSSQELVSKVLGSSECGTNVEQIIVPARGQRAAALAAQSKITRTILVDLGLWEL